MRVIQRPGPCATAALVVAVLAMVLVMTFHVASAPSSASSATAAAAHSRGHGTSPGHGIGKGHAHGHAHGSTGHGHGGPHGAGGTDQADDGIRTWTHANAEAAATGPVAEDQVRQSPFYTVRVAPAAAPSCSHESFTYLSVPRAGEGKRGYTGEDGADFAAEAGQTMSWSTFEYSTDVVVDVTLTTGATVSSLEQVTVRPTSLGLATELVDSRTVRVTVPASEAGYRFSVEFAPELMDVYADPVTGLTTEAAGHALMETEPRHAMLVFAQPPAPASTVPTSADGTIEYVTPGSVRDLDTTTAEILYFRPGTYWMGSDYRATLPANVKWVYLAPGAFVKGAFLFVDSDNPDYHVTGYGVLSGEQYGYETDTANGYQHRVADNCHGTCVKELQLGSTDVVQHLDLQGVTIKEPAYHSFVVYGNEDTFSMDVRNYQQVGSWYWQTDGLELYKDSTMAHTFFHANDDVLKLYHSDLDVTDTVVWKNENGPVFQWGWVPRDISDISVANTQIIHSRMYHGGIATNSCVFNASPHWADPVSTTTADPSMTVRNLRFTDTRVEGTVNCGIRIYALSSMEGVEIDGFQVDGWNGQDADHQQSALRLYTDDAGNRVHLGDGTTPGLRIRNYTVGGETILKAGDNWASTEAGRLNFDAEAWDGWTVEADSQPEGPAPSLSVTGLTDGATVASRDVALSGTTDAARLVLTVNGVQTQVPVIAGAFTVTTHLGGVSNVVRLAAYSTAGVATVNRWTVHAFGDAVASLSDPEGDDNGPGSYTYPTDSAFNPGSLDLTGTEVYQDGSTVRFVTTVRGQVLNPWGANGMSTQRLNIYLRPADATDTDVTALLPGTNTWAQGSWSRVVVGDGRNTSSPYGPGVYDAAGARLGEVELAVSGNRIIMSVDGAVLGGTDPATAGYQVSMFSSSEDGESVGNVRPVLSADCLNGTTCESWVARYRLGGGKGDLMAASPYDSDLTDSNAIDMITGEAAQAEVMSLSLPRVVAPYVTPVPAR